MPNDDRIEEEVEGAGSSLLQICVVELMGFRWPVMEEGRRGGGGGDGTRFVVLTELLLQLDCSM